LVKQKNPKAKKKYELIINDDLDNLLDLYKEEGDALIVEKIKSFIANPALLNEICCTNWTAKEQKPKSKPKQKRKTAQQFEQDEPRKKKRKTQRLEELKQLLRPMIGIELPGYKILSQIESGLTMSELNQIGINFANIRNPQTGLYKHIFTRKI
jgi:hypothetical protein